MKVIKTGLLAGVVFGLMLMGACGGDTPSSLTLQQQALKIANILFTATK